MDPTPGICYNRRVSTKENKLKTGTDTKNACVGKYTDLGTTMFIELPAIYLPTGRLFAPRPLSLIN